MEHLNHDILRGSRSYMQPSISNNGTNYIFLTIPVGGHQQVIILISKLNDT